MSAATSMAVMQVTVFCTPAPLAGQRRAVAATLVHVPESVEEVGARDADVREANGTVVHSVQTNLRHADTGPADNAYQGHWRNGKRGKQLEVGWGSPSLVSH